MKPSRRRLVVVPVALGLVLGIGGGALAAFSATTSDGVNRFVAAVDWQPPRVTRTVIAKSVGYAAGKIHQGGQFSVYAQVDDDGNPPAGVDSVAVDVSAFSGAGTAVPLSAGSFTVEGVPYNFGSNVLTASDPLAAGSQTYSITMADLVSPTPNTQTQGGFAVVVDNTAPTPVDMTSANGSGGTVGLVEQGDIVTYTWSEPIDPESLVPGWDGGSPTTVTVRIQNAGPNDRLTIRSGAGTTLAFGTVSLQQNYVKGPRDFTGSAISLLGDTVTIVLGSPSGATRLVTVPTPTTWTANAGAYDVAGNPCSATTVIGSGSPRVDF